MTAPPSMTLTRELISKTLAFDDGHAKGNQIVYSAKPSPQFWELWREHKDEIKQLGFRCSRREVDQEFEITLAVDVDEPIEARPNKSKTHSENMADFKAEWRKRASVRFDKMRQLVTDAPDPIDLTQQKP